MNYLYRVVQTMKPVSDGFAIDKEWSLGISFDHTPTEAEIRALEAAAAAFLMSISKESNK